MEIGTEFNSKDLRSMKKSIHTLSAFYFKSTLIQDTIGGCIPLMVVLLSKKICLFICLSQIFGKVI